MRERHPLTTSRGLGLRSRLPPIALVAVILVGWEGYVRLAGVSPLVLPGPVRIVEALWTYRADAVGHTIPTLVETVVGFAVAVVLAVGAAAAMDRASGVRRAVEPILVTSQTIPIVALAPLFLLWFGFGLAPKVLVVVLVTFFPIVVALLDGFRSAPTEASELMRSYGASDAQAFRKLRWPAALPNLFTGLRISVVYAVIGAVFGEYVGARGGLGIWMKLSQNAFRTDLVFAAVVVISALSLILYWLVGLARRMVIPWAPGVRLVADVNSRPF
jgi:ABC-type nitrate/sulfonate/bicarbonate transport system permease component